MTYTINVAKRNPITGRHQHLFRVEGLGHYEVDEVVNELRTRFATPDGEFDISVTHWEKRGREVDIDLFPVAE
jgi:hypothetical protein